MALLPGTAHAQWVAGDEYTAIGYTQPAHDNAVARLAAKLDSGEVTLEYKQGRGYLDSLLQALGVDPSSQVLVFSPTSLQYLKISPATPRALYFSDDTYVGWVQNSEIIELTVMDEKLGTLFYVFHNSPQAPQKVERENQRCLVCHDSTGTMGGGVPLLVARSGIYDRAGFNLRDLSGEGNTVDSTPVSERWGGWYVTGRQGNQSHFGNVVVHDKAQLEQVESLRHGSIETLLGNDWFDITPYARPTSDIVALMVMEHQLTVQNQLTYVKFKAPVVLDRVGHGDAVSAANWDELPERGKKALARMMNSLVRALMFIDAAPLDDSIGSTSGFAEWFQAQSARDGNGRSLRDLDLETRLFRYPLSYLVNSRDVQTLPPYARDYLYRELAAVLDGTRRNAPFDQLSLEALAQARDIARATVPELAPYLDTSVHQDMAEQFQGTSY